MGDMAGAVMALLLVLVLCVDGWALLDYWARGVAERSRRAAARELYAGQLRHAAEVWALAAPAAVKPGTPAPAAKPGAPAAPLTLAMVDRAVVAARAAALPADVVGLYWYCRRCGCWLEEHTTPCPRCAARPRLDFAPFRNRVPGIPECGFPACSLCYGP